MKGFEFGPMTDANDGRLFELLGQKLHQPIFTLRVERRGCFVQQDYIRSAKKDSCKRQALLLPARQDLIPRTFFVEVLDEVT
jgi:hypothetical protein